MQCLNHCADLTILPSQFDSFRTPYLKRMDSHKYFLGESVKNKQTKVYNMLYQEYHTGKGVKILNPSTQICQTLYHIYSYIHVIDV